jgi:hypothetical protein
MSMASPPGKRPEAPQYRKVGSVMDAVSYSSLDDALETLMGYGIELKNGNFNHAPMVAEALCAMGHPEAVMPWIERYRERMLPRPAASERISRNDWRSTLGRRDRFTDWAVFFHEELHADPWRRTLDRWVARLAPELSAAATHGIIRVGHAVRSLSAAETALRLRELGDALASWAATYCELPSRDRSANGTVPPREAITKIPIVATEHRRQGNITSALALLDGFHEFAPVIGLIDVSGNIDRLISELTEIFARVYLANAHDRLTAIVFIHGVTSLCALGNIIPAVSEITARAALPYGWQSGCALYACFGGGTAVAEEIDHWERDDRRLVDQALANGDEHVIKFTEACLHRHSLGPSPAYFAAVDNALGILPAR